MFKKLAISALALAAVAGSFAVTAPAQAQYWHRHIVRERHICYHRGGMWDHGVCVFPRHTSYYYGGVYRRYPADAGYWYHGRFYYYNR